MRSNPPPNQNPAQSASKPRRILFEILLLLVVALAIFLPRALKLDQFVTPDEEIWLTRSANFYMALAQHDFIDTYQKEHPGVPIMWAGAASYLLNDPGYRGSGQGQVSTMQFVYYMTHFAQVSLLDILVTARLFVVIAITACLLVAFLYLRRILGLLPALLGILLIAFDPFHLALSRLLHLDGLMSTLLFLSLLSFIGFLKDRRAIDLVISSGAAGLCWLTKSPGFILGLVVGLISLAALWQAKPGKDEKWNAKLAWRFIWPVLAWTLGGTIVYFIFWPAMWVNPLDTFTKVLSEAEGYAEKGHFVSVYFNGQIFPSGDLGLKYAYFYPLTYLWRATPAVIGGLLAAAWGFFARRKPFDTSNRRLTAISIVLLGLVFMVVMTLGLKKFDRYVLPIYLPFDVLAGMGLSALAYWLMEKWPSTRAKSIIYIALAILVGTQVYFAASTFPYYFSYYNPLLGGSHKAPAVMQIGWGEGLDQAARYLNTKPNADQLNAYAWYSGGSFSYFFKGNSFYLAPLLGEREGDLEKFLAADYAVIYIHQWQRNLPQPVLDIVRNLQPEKTIWIDGLEYVQIYKLH